MQILAPTGRDGDLLVRALRDGGLEAELFTASFHAISPAQRDAMGGLLMAEEALTEPVVDGLQRMLEHQPEWSDLPLLILTSSGKETLESRRRAHDRLRLGQLTLLERPLRQSSLLSSVRTALRARRRQFEVRDAIASRTEVLTALQQSEERARLILQSTRDCILLLDNDGLVQSINQEGLLRLGFVDPLDVVGKQWPELWGDDAETARAAFAQVKRAGIGHFEGRIRSPRGEETCWDISMTHVLNGGEKAGYLAVGREISDRKRTEQALIQSEKLAAVGRLAASISHEINNPLESVTNLLYLVETRDDLPKEVRELLEMADHELARVSQIVGQTLRFHRQATGPRETTPDELLQSVVALYHGRLQNSGIAVVRKHGRDGSVSCYENDVRQVLNNLVGNAIDAMKAGGRVILRTGAATDWRSGRTGVAITVADTGHGVARSVRERIFEPFYTTKGINGTGLGLWISRGIVDKHQGRLSMRSSTDPQRSGTIFRLFLPAQAPEPAASSA